MEDYARFDSIMRVNHLIVVLVTIGISEMVETINCNMTLLEYMQKKLILSKGLVDAWQKSKDKLAHLDNDEARQICSELVSEDSATAELCALFTEPTFKGTSSKWSHWGRIRRAYALLHENRDKFLKPYTALGKLDCLVSAVVLIVDNEFCLTELENSNIPQLRALNYLNPALLGRTNITRNDLTMGTVEGDEPTPTTVLVSGPNGKGKSVNSVLAITHLILLSQSLCIASAKSFKHTPFLLVITLMKVESDISKNQSLYTNSLARTKMVRSKIKENTILEDGTLDRDSAPLFIALDEPFGGTTDKKLASKAGTLLIKMIGLTPHVICIVTTHIQALTSLPEMHPKTFANYKATDDFRMIPGIGAFELADGIHMVRQIMGDDFANQLESDSEDSDVSDDV